MKEEIIMGLCESRHAMPECVKEYVYPNEINPVDFSEMRKIAWDKIHEKIAFEVELVSPHNAADYTDYPMWVGQQRLVLYVTGLTAACAAVISVCADCGVELTLMHYDRETGAYLPQPVL